MDEIQLTRIAQGFAESLGAIINTHIPAGCNDIEIAEQQIGVHPSSDSDYKIRQTGIKREWQEIEARFVVRFNVVTFEATDTGSVILLEKQENQNSVEI